MCSDIRNDKIPLLQVYNAMRKVFTHKQQEHHSAAEFKDAFEQSVRAMKAVGITTTLSLACLELEAHLDSDKTNPPTDDVKQARAFERFMALAYLHQCDNSAETTRTMLKTQYVQAHDEYPSNITVAANLVKATKKDSRPNRGSRPALALAQRSTRSTYNPSAERACLLCGSPDHWQRECPDNVGNGGDLQPVATVLFPLPKTTPLPYPIHSSYLFPVPCVPSSKARIYSVMLITIPPKVTLQALPLFPMVEAWCAVLSVNFLVYLFWFDIILTALPTSCPSQKWSMNVASQ